MFGCVVMFLANNCALQGNEAVSTALLTLDSQPVEAVGFENHAL